MAEFCGSDLWNWNVTWHTENPDFTPCFEKTVLAWAACAFLWTAGTVEFAFRIRRTAKRTNHRTFLNTTQRLLTVALIIIEILAFAFAFRKRRDTNSHTYPVDKVTPAVKAVSFAFALTLQYVNKWKGVASSGVLFTFWFLEAFFGALRFQTAIRHLPSEDEYTHLRFTLLVVSFPLVVVVAQLFLHFFSHSEQEQHNVLNSGGTGVHKPCPEKRLSFPVRITFQWFWSMAIVGFKRPLEINDLWDLNPEDKSKVLVERFNSTWRDTLDASQVKSVTQSTKKYKDANDDRFGRKIVSILPVLWRCNQRTLLLGGLSKFISDMLIFVSPSILDLLIEHVEAEEERWKSYFYAALLYINVTLQILFLGQYFRNTFITGMRTRSSLIGAIYQKALLVSNTARKESTVGDIVNLMSVDTQKLADSPMFLHILWTAPIQITLAMYFLWTTLGPSILAGVAVLLTLIPSNIWILRRVKRLQVRQMKLKDMRVKLMSEILAGMKVLKLYAWEPFFEDQIQSIRRQEMEFLRTEAFFNSLSSFIWFIAPFLVSLVTFATYVLIDEKNVLDPRKAFVSLTYFNILKPPMTILPNALVSVMQAAVSVKRLSRFMNAEEIDSDAVARGDSSDGSAGVSINNGNFSWGQRPILRNINLKAEKGSLLAIIGTVGSGKSSLLSAVLGEMVKESGTVNTKGSVAYVAQQAWIQNATLRDNILFGKKFDEDRYERVVSACALKPDLKILPGGDRIEIGEMGINLSGGQKQRVSLARAVYQDADIYILDDPLSAVDAHVGRHLFEQVIGPSGMLRSKTRLVVTHSVTYLSQMDAIAVMSEGEIVELGTFHELMELKGVLAELVAQHSNVEDAEAAQPLDDTEDRMSVVHVDTESEKQEQGDNTSRRSSDSSISDAANEKLITIEKAQTGSIQADVYKYFIRSFSVKLATCTLSIFVVLHVLSLLSSIWLAEWSNVEPTNGTQDPMTRDLYLGVYGGYGLGQAIASFAGNVALALGCLQASGLLHNNMLSSILRAPMSFFDTTPLGRIVNRFSRDVDVMDNTFPGNLRTFIIYLFQVISTLIVISYSIPLFLLVVFPIGVLYYAVQRFYVASSRQLKRLESLTRSPVYSHFSETLTGTSTIRAFGFQRQFIEHSERKVDYNQMTYYPSIIANRWVGFNLETLGNLIVLFAALLAVISDRDQSSLGLSVSYALTITQALKWLVRVSADVEMNVVSVERLKEYGEVEQEAVWNLPDHSPPENWPTKGEVKFVKYETRYREGLDLILRGITCTINPGEKIGIVGRTGAGKSSLTLALFRIIEASGGSIEIDGHTLADLGLHDVRSRLTIIPQDPVLFAGSLRMNLDPADKYSDDEIWRALEHAHLNDFAKSLPLGLSYEILEGGGNLSVGQRQLVCLARALLRKTKILILDEATAAVDLDTDDLIQRTIRSEFKGCTVLTIAHRLKTIMDYDRVMVLDKGEIREFASPSELLADPHSIFFGMAKNSSAG